MKVLVTGAAGFIGSAVVRHLLGAGHEVRCLIEPGGRRDNLTGLDVEVVSGDVRDRAAATAALAGREALLHLAAIYAMWLPDPSLIYDVNVEGTKTMLWAALKAGVSRVVYTSSIAAVGRPERGGVADETRRFSRADWRDGNAYIRSKWLSERDALRFAAEGLPLVVVNPAFPFGERDLQPTPTGKFIVDALAGRVPAVPAGGFCAVDVEDVAAAHVSALSRGRVGERYILGNHNVTFRDFYRLVCARAGVPPPRVVLPRWAASAAAWAIERATAATVGGEPRAHYKAARYAAWTLYYSGDKARRELDLRQTPLEVTIDRAIAWFRAHPTA